MTDSTREGCGRCSITTVVDATADEPRNPLGDDRIEPNEAILQAASPGAWLGRPPARLNVAAERFVHDDRQTFSPVCEPSPRRVYTIWHVLLSTIVEGSTFGFKRHGTWDEVIKHEERITRTLRDVNVNSTAFDDQDKWRPKSRERFSEDVNEKTAQQASVDEGEGEKVGRTPNDDLKTADGKLSRSYERVEEGDSERATEPWQNSINYVVRAVDSIGREALRKVEDTVYRSVTIQLAPYYFDNKPVSVNIQQIGHVSGDEWFVSEVNANDDELKSIVSETLRDFKDEVDRQYIDTPKETEVAEAVEGMEVSMVDEKHWSD